MQPRLGAARAAMLLSALLTAAALAGCSAQGGAPASSEPGATSGASASAAAEAGSCAGVAVVVEYGALGRDASTSCVDVTAPTTALDIVEQAGLDIEGTAQYGDAIVCRVDGLPSADQPLELPDGTSHTESCESMPPMEAYWSLWLAPTADAAWDYAPEGIDTLQVAPGERLGLVFTTGTESTPPNS